MKALEVGGEPRGEGEMYEISHKKKRKEKDKKSDPMVATSWGTNESRSQTDLGKGSE